MLDVCKSGPGKAFPQPRGAEGSRASTGAIFGAIAANMRASV
jgi:hypothetical protein